MRKIWAVVLSLGRLSYKLQPQYCGGVVMTLGARTRALLGLACNGV